jgi:hypothetical protein
MFEVNEAAIPICYQHCDTGRRRVVRVPDRAQRRLIGHVSISLADPGADEEQTYPSHRIPVSLITERGVRSASPSYKPLVMGALHSCSVTAVGAELYAGPVQLRCQLSLQRLSFLAPLCLPLYPLLKIVDTQSSLTDSSLAVCFQQSVEYSAGTAGSALPLNGSLSLVRAFPNSVGSDTGVLDCTQPAARRRTR